jgi:hypothetical protein
VGGYDLTERRNGLYSDQRGKKARRITFAEFASYAGGTRGGRYAPDSCRTALGPKDGTVRHFGQLKEGNRSTRIRSATTVQARIEPIPI